MNIVYVIKNIDPASGGTERVSTSVATTLEQQGVSTFFLFSGKDWTGIETSRKSKFEDSWDKIKLTNFISNFVDEKKIDVIIVVNQCHQGIKFQKVFSHIKAFHPKVRLVSCLHAAPGKWINKNKFAYTWKKIYFKDLLKSIVYKVYNPSLIRARGMYDLSDKVVLLSESYKKEYEQSYGISDKCGKLISIPNPCPFNEKYDGESKDNVIVAVGRMEESQKRISAILKIWSHFCKENKGWKLQIVGDGPNLNQYKQIAKKLNLESICFTGHQTDVAKFYKNAKIFLMTSSWEGLPMTLLEAQYYGCIPIVFDSFSSVHDLINNGVDGFIVENNDIQTFVERLNDLVKRPQKIHKMNELIRNKSKERFLMEDIAIKWNDLLENL